MLLSLFQSKALKVLKVVDAQLLHPGRLRGVGEAEELVGKGPLLVVHIGTKPEREGENKCVF